MIIQELTISFADQKAPKLNSRYGEEGRQYLFTPDQEIPEGSTVVLQIVKPDRNFVIENAAITEDKILVTIPQQATVVKGIAYYNIEVQKSGLLIYSAEGEIWVDDALIDDSMIESISEVFGYKFPDDFITYDKIVPLIINDSVTGTTTTWSSSFIQEKISEIQPGSTVVVNPTDQATATAEKIKVDGTTYDFPAYSDVEVNPSDTASSTMEKIKVDGTTYDLPTYPESLAELEDTSIVTPAEGDLLTYDSVTQKWINDAPPAAPDLEDLGDVDITYPTDGDVLVYDDTENKWVNAAPPAVPDLDDLGDVDITTPADGDILQYDATDDDWKNTQLPPIPPVSTTVTGNPIELTDAASAPMVKCETQITGSQDLHGYDKPWVGGAGKNKLIDSGYVQGVLGWNETTAESIVANSHFITSPYMPINNNTAYTLSAIHGGIVRIYVTDENHNTLYFRGNNPTEGNNEIIPATSGAVYCRVSIGIDDETVIPSDYGTKVYGQLELGSSATAYAPYSNICPITAYTEGEIEVRGKNLFDKNANDIAVGYYLIASTGVLSPSQSGYNTSGYIPIEPNTDYTKSGASVAADEYCFYDSAKTFISGLSRTDTTVLSPNNAAYMRFDYKASETDSIQIEKGSTATSYEPYKGTTHTTTYPSAIYRGSEDVVNGTETHNMPVIDLGSLFWTYESNSNYFGARLTGIKKYNNNDTPLMVCEGYQVINARYGSAMSGVSSGVICPRAEQDWIQIKDTNYTDATLFKTSVTGMKLAYELATPSTSSVTPTNLPIRTLSGYNHIESSTGEMEVEYINQRYQPLLDAAAIMIENNVTSLRSTPAPVQSIQREELQPITLEERVKETAELADLTEEEEEENDYED